MKPVILAAASLAGASIFLALNNNRAAGQNALGGGNALDANLGINSGGINQPRSGEDFRARNLVVTGDVAGGRGFRGAVGYTAPGDFRGALGSNDTFQFRADSAVSSPQLFGLGSTYQQLRFGQDMALIEFRRANSGNPASIDVQNPIAIGNISGSSEVNSARLRLDRTSLASSTDFNLRDRAEPRVVGITYNQEREPLFFNASTVRGLTLEPVNQSVATIGLSTLDAARVREDMERGEASPDLGGPFQTRFDPTRLGRQQAGQQQRDADAANAAADPNANANPARVDTAVRPDDYNKILQRIADRYANRGEQVDFDVAPEILDELDQNYQQLRDQLSGNSPAANDAGTLSPSEAAAQRDSRGQASSGQNSQSNRISPTGPDRILPPGSRIDSEVRPEIDRKVRPNSGPTSNAPTSQPPTGRNDMEGGAPRADGERTPMEGFGSALRHGHRVERLSAEQQDRFNELLASAERNLREGEYFQAERRFERALRFTPGHPMASIGAVHSQLGAGLYLSASLSLRNLLSTQPEMIDVTYSPDLLPRKERLDAIVAALQNRLANDPDRGSYALLLAYVGRQLNDRSLMQQGLDAMVVAEPEGKLGQLLRDIWLAAPETPARPQTPASTATPPVDSGK